MAIVNVMGPIMIGSSSWPTARVAEIGFLKQCGVVRQVKEVESP